MKAGVIYARYSSHNQREESIEGQLRECKRYAQREGIEVVGEYIDRAQSGKTDHRPQFQKMIKDAEKGRFSVVIVYKLDRFARNRYDSATYKAKLSRQGVKVVSAMEAVQDGPEGIILEAVLEGMAEYYSANLAQNIKRGMTENALKGMANGGGQCLGYCTGPDKKYQIDPAGADTVRLIFELYAQGNTYAAIIKQLNEQGRTTLRGKPFNKNSLGTILHNRRYIGEYVWGDIVVPGGMPQIIDRDLWERVQIRLSSKERASARARGEYEYILSGKLFCGTCGEPMTGDSGTSRNGTKYHYYTCSTKKHGEKCSKKSVRAKALEDEVIRSTVQLILQDSTLETIVDKVMEYQSKDTESAALLQEYHQQLKETQSAINGIMKAIEAGLYTDDMKSRMEELAATKSGLTSHIAQEEANQKGVTREELLFFLRQYRQGDPNDPNYRRKLIRTFVNSIWLYDDKLVITYNYNGENNKVTLDLLEAALSESNFCSNNACQSPPTKTKANIFVICHGVFAFGKEIADKV